MKKLNCKVCGKKTLNIFNIKLTATPICESCANQITLQQVKDLVYKTADNKKENNND